MALLVERRFIETERDGAVFVIRMARPEARNAFNLAMSAEMEAAVDAFEADSSLHVAVIAGTEEAFSAGADLKEVAEGKEFKGARGGFGIFGRPAAEAGDRGG